MITLKQVNRALNQAGIDAELIKGDGYMYFIGGDVDGAYSTSVYVPRINDLSIDHWVTEAKYIKESR